MSEHPHEYTSPYPILDPQNVPIAGNMMIEASAGTGKTYTITLLVLRLLLGVNVERTPLKLPEILIVTFTNAATAELKERIYSRIVDLKLSFFEKLIAIETGEVGEAQDEALSVLIEQYLAQKAETQIDENSALETAINLLIEAEGAIDQASIFTIHAFSQRLLKENALDLGQSFNFELATDLSKLYREAVYHFWREECYPLEYEYAQSVANFYDVPVSIGSGLYKTNSLFSKIESLVRDPNLIEADRFIGHDNLKSLFGAQNAFIESVKARALQHFSLAAYREMVDTVGLNKRSYTTKIIERSHKHFMDWAKNGTGHSFEDMERFFLKNLEDKLGKEGDLSRLSPELKSLFKDLESLKADRIASFHYAASKVVKILQMLKRESGVLGFDDLLTELNKKTASMSEGFIEALHLRYKAVMIDEFQDTDNLQLETFRRLFFDFKHIPFVMIGDPKQSIYGFRGADINAYLSIKKDVDQIYTLNTNYRSGSMQVEAVNHLFGRKSNIEPPFIVENIPFINIKTPESAKETRLEVDGLSRAGMTFLEYSTVMITGDRDGADSLANPVFRERIAGACAKEIGILLEAGELVTAKGRQKVMPEDITILVRSGTEAGVMQEALRNAGINAVYLSERNSVFDPESSIVGDLYLFLRSLVFKHEKRVLMQSLGSVLYGFSVTEYEQITKDHEAFEALLRERNHLSDIWEKHGVLAMIRDFMVREDRLARLLALENGERLASDLFHLGELLQRESFSNAEALLLWLHDKMFGFDEGEGAEIRLESDFKTIQIMTIHKSKGLEFPIVFLPFGLFKTRAENAGVYVAQPVKEGEGEGAEASIAEKVGARRYIFANEGNSDETNYFQRQAIAEDIRLLYVALTRAKFHTYVGYSKDLKKRMYENNALAYLMGIERDMKGAGVNFNEGIHNVTIFDDFIDSPIKKVEAEKSLASKTPAIFNRPIAPLWRFTSFSSLSYNAKASYFTPLLEDELELETDENPADTMILAESLFPKGAITGNFIHEILEDYPPAQLEDRELLEKEVVRNFAHLVSESQLPALTDELMVWLQDILHAKLPLTQNLNEILSGNLNIKELEFIFPIENRVHKDALNAILNTHLERSPDAGLQFETIEGFLRGFIDLFFELDGKYYVADYKSNTLGTRKQDYHEAQMLHSIKHAHYDLQYLIYTVAVVKFLKNQKPDFDYERDFGGVFYFYLRGMASGETTGIYYIKPDYEIIETLIDLFGEDSKEDL